MKAIYKILSILNILVGQKFCDFKKYFIKLKTSRFLKTFRESKTLTIQIKIIFLKPEQSFPCTACNFRAVELCMWSIV